jgi:hypothetical protein
MKVDWSTLEVIGADLPPRLDVPARLIPIVRSQSGELYRLRPTRHGDALEPLDDVEFRADCENGDAAPLFPRVQAREGHWLIVLGASGWRYCEGAQAIAALDEFAAQALEQAERALLSEDFERAFALLDNAVLARPDDLLARAALLAMVRSRGRDDAGFYEQGLEELRRSAPSWAETARTRHSFLFKFVIRDRELAKKLDVLPGWLPAPRRIAPSSHFARSPGARRSSPQHAESP